MMMVLLFLMVVESFIRVLCDIVCDCVVLFVLVLMLLFMFIGCEYEIICV